MNKTGIMCMMKVLAAFILSITTTGAIAQNETKQQVRESIQTLQAQIEQLKNELDLPTVKIAYGKNGVKYEIMDCFWYDGSVVIKIKVSSETRKTINISGLDYAYMNGYWFSSYNSRISDDDYSNISHDCLLKPDVPRIIYKFYNLEGDSSHRILELNKVRMVEYFSIKDEKSQEVLEFRGIPIKYED